MVPRASLLPDLVALDSREEARAGERSVEGQSGTVYFTSSPLTHTDLSRNRLSFLECQLKGGNSVLHIVARFACKWRSVPLPAANVSLFPLAGLDVEEAAKSLPKVAR